MLTNEAGRGDVVSITIIAYYLYLHASTLGETLVSSGPARVPPGNMHDKQLVLSHLTTVKVHAQPCGSLV